MAPFFCLPVSTLAGEACMFTRVLMSRRMFFACFCAPQIHAGRGIPNSASADARGSFFGRCQPNCWLFTNASSAATNRQPGCGGEVARRSVNSGIGGVFPLFSPTGGFLHSTRRQSIEILREPEPAAPELAISMRQDTIGVLNPNVASEGGTSAGKSEHRPLRMNRACSSASWWAWCRLVAWPLGWSSRSLPPPKAQTAP